MTIDNWVELITAILVVIAGVITLYVKKRTDHNKKGDDNVTKNKITQNGSNGNNVVVQNGGTATIHQGNHATNLHEQETEDSNKSNTQSNRSEIHLAEIYTSLFAEDNKLKREKIVIRSQEHNRIEGYVELSESDGHGHIKNRLTYTLSGLYTNKILTAEYISTDNTNDERGVISLKLVGPKLLSGFCSFSKISSSADDEIFCMAIF